MTGNLSSKINAAKASYDVHSKKKTLEQAKKRKMTIKSDSRNIQSFLNKMTQSKSPYILSLAE